RCRRSSPKSCGVRLAPGPAGSYISRPSVIWGALRSAERGRQPPEWDKPECDKGPARREIAAAGPGIGVNSMDACVGKLKPGPTAAPRDADAAPKIVRPSRAEAEEAVRTLIAWAGDDPDREGLVET